MKTKLFEQNKGIKGLSYNGTLYNEKEEACVSLTFETKNSDTADIIVEVDGESKHFCIGAEAFNRFCSGILDIQREINNNDELNKKIRYKLKDVYNEYLNQNDMAFVLLVGNDYTYLRIINEVNEIVFYKQINLIDNSDINYAGMQTDYNIAKESVSHYIANCIFDELHIENEEIDSRGHFAVYIYNHLILPKKVLCKMARFYENKKTQGDKK